VRKGSGHNFFRTEVSARADRTCGSRLTGPCWSWRATLTARPGPLSYIIVVWWDKGANLYRYFTCFKDVDSGCEVRGTAPWDRDKLVNDYEEVVDGKKDTVSRHVPRHHAKFAHVGFRLDKG
jgi:hypothetical protein